MDVYILVTVLIIVVFCFGLYHAKKERQDDEHH